MLKPEQAILSCTGFWYNLQWNTYLVCCCDIVRSGINVIPEVLCWVTNPGVQHPPPSAVVEDLAASLGKELSSKRID